MKTKGLLFDIRRYAVHDGPGIRTTVFFKGCPLNCLWCHNPESILPGPQTIARKRKLGSRTFTSEEIVGHYYTTEEAMNKIRQDRMFFDESNGGVSFSGGEPLLQKDFLLALLKQCREEGIHTTLDTCGYAPEADFSEVAQNTDLLLFDIKTAHKQQHEQFTGKDNTLILQNLLNLKGDGPEVIIRVPVIPGFNNSTTEMTTIVEILKKCKARIKEIHLMPYHKLGRQKYEALGMATPPTFEPEPPAQQMQAFLKIFRDDGFNAKSGG